MPITTHPTPISPEAKYFRRVITKAVFVTGRITLAILVSIGPFPELISIVLAQSCQVNLDEYAVGIKAPSADGRVHITVNYAAGEEGSPNAQTRRAMESAIAEWNSFTAQTNVIFEVAAAGTTADLEFVQTTDSSVRRRLRTT